MAVIDKIVKLTKQLYPTGRAWKLPIYSNFEGLHSALAIQEEKAYKDALATLNSILPDNAKFTTEDATQWEVRLGLITNQAVSLEDRKLAIKRKLNQPGAAPAKSNWRYLQKQLQDAGFNVWVHENIPTQTIEAILEAELVGQLDDFQLDDRQLGTITDIYNSYFSKLQLDDFQLGEYQLGEATTYKNKCANFLYKEDDLSYLTPDYKNVFYIGGETLGTFVDVDSERESEFRQLILTIKPTNTVAYLLINYV